MKIGILTFHNAINPGAYAQTFALMNIIKNFVHEVEIINYIRPTATFLYLLNIFLNKNPTGVFLRAKRHLKYRTCQKRFNLNPKNFVISSMKLKTDKYDVVIVGSDCVWSYQRLLMGPGRIFFGIGLHPEKKLLYYAASCTANIDDIPPNFVIDGLKKFSTISVRDKNSKDIVKKYVGVDAEIVLDPTFLFDFSGYEILPKAKDYLLVYAVDQLNDSQIKQIKNFAMQKNIQLIAIHHKLKWCDKNVIAVDPFEWMGYFKNATYVVTTTFHGTIFSIKYNTNFCVVDNSRIHNKTQTILSELNLQNRVISNNNSIENIFNNKIDYNMVNSKLNFLKNKSLNFLKMALKEK